MKHQGQSQAAHVSDLAFAREVWRHTERNNIEGAMIVRDLWKHSKPTVGYGKQTGPLTAHEIGAFAKKHAQAGELDLVGFARAIERAALIKAYTLLPELRQAEEAKHYRRYFRNGVEFGLAIYSSAIRTLALGQTQDEIEMDIPAKPVKPRMNDEIAKLEKAPGADAIRPVFDAWAGSRQFDLRRLDGEYANIVTAYAWMGWLGASMNKEDEIAQS